MAYDSSGVVSGPWQLFFLSYLSAMSPLLEITWIHLLRTAWCSCLVSYLSCCWFHWSCAHFWPVPSGPSQPLLFCWLILRESPFLIKHCYKIFKHIFCSLKLFECFLNLNIGNCNRGCSNDEWPQYTIYRIQSFFASSVEYNMVLRKTLRGQEDYRWNAWNIKGFSVEPPGWILDETFGI